MKTFDKYEAVSRQSNRHGITITPKAIMSTLQTSFRDIDKKAKEEIYKRTV